MAKYVTPAIFMKYNLADILFKDTVKNRLHD